MLFSRQSGIESFVIDLYSLTKGFMLSTTWNYVPTSFLFHRSIQTLEQENNLQTELWSCILTCQARIGHILPLAAYLLKPVQRVLKYQLLLQVSDMWNASNSLVYSFHSKFPHKSNFRSGHSKFAQYSSPFPVGIKTTV